MAHITSKKTKKMLPGTNSRKNKNMQFVSDEKRNKLLPSTNAKIKDTWLVLSKMRKKPRGISNRKNR